MKKKNTKRVISAPDTLDQLSKGRRNNLDMIRFIAASMVLFSHSYPLTGGASVPDPLNASVHFLTFGGLGVYIFFFISGFLVTKSYCARHELLTFAKARCLRIFPGLFVAMLVCILLIGPLATTLPLGDYFASRDTWGFLLHNTLLYKLSYNLPGVFAANPYPVAVNGSLWTLPVEFKMYILVALIGVVGLLKDRRIFNVVASVSLLILTLLMSSGVRVIDEANVYMIGYFILGGIVCMNRHLIRLNPLLLCGMWLVFLLAYFIGLDQSYIKLLFIPVLSYTILHLAYHPSVRFHHFGKYGDFSYGMYIYAFPVQQLIAGNLKNLSPLMLFLMAMPVTFVLSVLSWHFIEKPALALKDVKFGRLWGRKPDTV